ncbi:alkyl hydroperoxide reductase/ Thiol specific antioxidant/ Mal allergen [Chloroherpeton thalassium ATCC 35110]|uniref:thioredoxin-dependent peroxiredoxin n=1 Tax=Chloroherpeton thalassium (strain ATCC 35110 / GB-78) TaxID=517418 RepID=B3QZ95_CHLT3|nr:peroxiredoxin [Chloroherpeton thalassium]ACF13788.1 alkyl hydroperoxide reductase/ Thiol specific antioxidant/ Mal allergen [Chloroherpeton thalassium ATCC 35110]
MATHIKFLLSVWIFFLVGCGSGKEGLEIGDKAPDFSLPSDDGQLISLSEYKNHQIVVLYFYPKDNTPGCITEACSFRDRVEEYKAAGVAVIGVSTDDAESHKDFRETHKLNFTLISDTKKKTTEAYGALTSLGFARRMTFVIDKSGIIRKIYPDVTPSGHASEVLEFIKSLE